jgi:DNA-binding MarR family transcriptional regulator
MKNNNLALLFSMTKANSVITRRLSVHGLDFSDFIILYYLNEAEGKKLRRIDLAQKLGLTASGITRMLLPLEKIHVITRDQSDEDARARYATMTKAGEQLFNEALATMNTKLEDAIPADAEKLLPEFSAFLDKLTGNLLPPEVPREPKIRLAQ